MKRDLPFLLFFAFIISAFCARGFDDNAYGDIGWCSNNIQQSFLPGCWATTPPVIDGAIDAVWQYATIHRFQLVCGGILPGYPWIAGPESHNGSIRLLNDNQNLYMLIQIYYEDYNASTYNFDELDIYFDGNGNGFLDPVEDAKYCLVSSGLEDWHYSSSTAQEDTMLNGALGKSHTNPVNGRVGNYTFELRVPLNSTDINDIATSTNKTIGACITSSLCLLKPFCFSLFNV